MKVNGMKMLAMIVRTFMTSFCRFSYAGQIHVHQAAGQLAIRLHTVHDLHTVVIAVAQIHAGRSR